VTFRPAGEARLDLYTDALDTRYRPGYVRGAAQPARRPYVAPTTRGRGLPAVLGDAPGVFEDVEQGLRLQRSQTGRSLMLIEQGRVYSIPVYLVLGQGTGSGSRARSRCSSPTPGNSTTPTVGQTVLEVRA